VYDAHLAQNARLLQGVMSLPVQSGSREAMYQAFNEALAQAGHHRPGHPYESKLAFQVWGEGGVLLVHTPVRPS
jgi:two-component system sensor histidine kinase QseC